MERVRFVFSDSLEVGGYLSAGFGEGEIAEHLTAADLAEVLPKETSDTNGRVTATDPVNTAVPDLQQEFTQA